MTYKIGTRVKKARGEADLGITGVVHCGPSRHGHTLSQSKIGADMYVLFDSVWTGVDCFHPSGTVGMARSEQYDPIIPEGHRAGEEGTCEPLDKLLSEVRHASVE